MDERIKEIADKVASACSAVPRRNGDRVWIKFTINNKGYCYSLTIPNWDKLFKYIQKMKSNGVKQEARCKKVLNWIKKETDPVDCPKGFDSFPLATGRIG